MSALTAGGEAPFHRFASVHLEAVLPFSQTVTIWLRKTNKTTGGNTANITLGTFALGVNGPPTLPNVCAWFCQELERGLLANSTYKVLPLNPLFANGVQQGLPFAIMLAHAAYKAGELPANRFINVDAYFATGNSLPVPSDPLVFTGVVLR